MDEKLFHKIAEEVEKELMCHGLTGGLYENFGKEILIRYLAAQQSVQADERYCVCKVPNFNPVSDRCEFCRKLARH